MSIFADSQPHVLKGDLLDLDFSMDMDHRKRRRNRTTQSCLNCHTSKRKCDRKRPCQRCIQLGLTGLCVYEVDDPALRDDPDIDETTRLRNRIAELESLVRELRGKPHPRWADPNYYEGDASDKWHTRSQKRGANGANNTPNKRRAHSPEPTAQVAVKTEPAQPELQQQQQQQQGQGHQQQSQPHYYRLSPSPPPGSAHPSHPPHPHPYPTLHTNGTYPPPPGASNDACSPVTYSPASPATSAPGYESSSSASSVIGGGGAYQYPTVDDRRLYTRATDRNGNGTGPYPPRYDDLSCSCVSNPNTGHAFVNLARQLDNALSCIQHLPEHGQHNRCALYNRIQELKSILHGEDPPKSVSPPFGAFDSHSDNLRSPVDSDLMTPLSVTSSVPLSTPATPHTLQTMHWDSAPSHQNGAYNPYFSTVQPVTDVVYSKSVSTYDVVT